MKYRRFKDTDIKLSLFGLGCMRFPTEEDADGNQRVKKDEAITLIHAALERGVNYFDTAYPYHRGESEPILGEALTSANREDAFIATKSPVWDIKQHDDFERIIDEQLERLNTDYIDFYLLHSLNRKYWDTARKNDALRFLDKVRGDKRVRFAGFSFHDNFDVFQEILQAYDWDITQIQLNFLDQEYQAGLKGLRLASERGVPVVVMEPLRGGRLASPPSGEIAEAWNKSAARRTPVEWAFRWLYNLPQINVILSGVTTMEQLKEDVEIFDRAEANCMSQEELRIVDEVKRLYETKLVVGCTGCNYCMPCPSRVEIPSIFELYNNSSLYNDLTRQGKFYRKWFDETGRGAQACIECGKCEEACPQELPVIELLKEAHSHLVSE